MRVTTSSSPGRRNVMMLASSDRPWRVEPVTFSERTISHPAALRVLAGAHWLATGCDQNENKAELGEKIHRPLPELARRPVTRFLLKSTVTTS